ncbi:hypothetical protein [Arenimonas fontis]|uniref:Uncharacterized protein n=1 Tax=Arenimonas fontis TaxID=2608255 RepID=A0A5B2ZBE6_9GAMM|nr:hypothetical protein [Arenimonas fontis]KAA2285446.1 hypothetical protein F0415_05910 [Arenimonas fontis]
MKDLHTVGEHTVTPEEALQWAVERIGMHERAIASMAGRLNGLAYAVQCLIATHPKIETMQLLWKQALPEVVDEEMAGKLHQTSEYRQALHSQMAMVQKTIDARLEGQDQSTD